MVGLWEWGCWGAKCSTNGELAILVTEGVILPSITAWYPGALKFGLVYSEASKGRLSSEVICPCLGPAELRGVKVIVGVGSMALLWDPEGL